MEIKFIKPKSKILQKHIEGYYFLTQKRNEPEVEYLTFPNNYSIISVYEKTKCEFSENKAVLSENASSPFCSDLICHYKKPIHLSYSGSINELTFYFKPLGLNAFLDNNLCIYTSSFFSKFIPFDDYQTVMQTILTEENFQIKIDLIENYWLSKLKGFTHPFLNEIIVDLSDINNDYSINELAKKHNISRQNLGKHFETHLCKSPSDFKKIQRFREALKLKTSKKSATNLTTLSYDMLFYDQSHLIKDFKSLTGLSPKKFFENLTSHDDGKINWLFLQ
ncbi:helix-turn-helix domain-containing protein [Flavobacterium paronense]|uniref:Helix-turn-helix domain-containing protein n=1 Tax=Flavobacterium paronense TaxID=1392775 RepID=A0ABV5GCE8_9FLAO|nr:helix-turn-helix domain-containing protein [Flavobacterium paronense]MDN3677906.1 helix-turn-helix domain-containing protein [Flavobacterium paronense]